MSSTDSVNDNHHPTFYFLDAPVVFQIFPGGVPGVLYRLHPGVLGIRSPFFATLFSLPRGPAALPNVRSEGASDDNPIQLPITLEQQDFDNLLCYIYLGPSPHPKTYEFLISLLKMSAFFQINDGIAHVVQQFEVQGNVLDAGLQFELARLYRIDEWIEPSFEKLVKLPFTKLTAELMSQMGNAAFSQLLKTKGEIEKVRRKFTFNAPPVCTHPECDNPPRCMASWTCEWYRSVPKRIHHPKEECFITLAGFLMQLSKEDITDLCNGCRDRTITWIWGTGYGTKEMDLTKQAVEALMALQTHEPVRGTVRIENGRLIAY
ncbi:hypothetical protein R3P38DRAFT_2648677 [Favolaschia claudopus]|uniref:BTB domain-containing protein n=1 Tax=Favolaschia claudopus TaxID=2862362 RepID=A0AAW0A6X2_9AGAR